MMSESIDPKIITARATERGILFSAPMVRAILAGKKICTRRIVNETTLRVSLDRPISNAGDIAIGGIPGMEVVTAPKGVHQARLNRNGAVTISKLNFGVKPGEFDFRCPYVDGITRIADYPRAKPSSRDGWHTCWSIRPFANQRLWVRETWRKDETGLYYRADHDSSSADALRWSPAIHMSRKDARIVLDVVEVRIERLHWIDDAEARHEGVTNRAEFEELWKSLNGAESWDANPWTWRIEFGRIQQVQSEQHEQLSLGVR